MSVALVCFCRGVSERDEWDSHSPLPAATDRAPMAWPGLACWILRKGWREFENYVLTWGKHLMVAGLCVQSHYRESLRLQPEALQSSVALWACLKLSWLSFYQLLKRLVCQSENLEHWRNIIRKNAVRNNDKIENKSVPSWEYIWLPLAVSACFHEWSRIETGCLKSPSLSHALPLLSPFLFSISRLTIFIIFIYIPSFQYLPFVWITHWFLMKYFETLGIAES